MIRFVLDTDILSLYRSGHPRVDSRVRQSTPGEVGIAVISIEEQLAGWYALLRRAKRSDQLAYAYEQLAEAVVVLAKLPILPFPEPTILRYEALKRRRLGVRSMDLRIAAIVLEAGAVLVTRNARDFGRVPGLTIEDWSL